MRKNFFLINFFLMISACNLQSKPLVNDQAALQKISKVELATQQRELLNKLTFTTIIPLYQQFINQTAKLAEQSHQFCSKPDLLRLTAVKKHWGETLSAWMRTEMLLFGPAIEEQLDFTIYFYPAKKNVINKLLQSETPINIEQLEQLGVGGQGLATLEYLLFDRTVREPEILQRFQGKMQNRRCQYLVTTSQLLLHRAQKIYAAWDPGQGNYAAAVTRAGLDSLVYTEASQPLDAIVNKIFQSVEKISSRKLAVPLGKKAPSQPKPYKLEAWRSGHSLANINATLQGIDALMKNGLYAWLIQQGHAETASKIEQNMGAIKQRPLSSTDLFQILKTNPGELDSLYLKTKELTRCIKHEFAPTMQVQLGFNDNDGD